MSDVTSSCLCTLKSSPQSTNKGQSTASSMTPSGKFQHQLNHYNAEKHSIYQTQCFILRYIRSRLSSLTLLGVHKIISVFLHEDFTLIIYSEYINFFFSSVREKDFWSVNYSKSANMASLLCEKYRYCCCQGLKIIFIIHPSIFC